MVEIFDTNTRQNRRDSWHKWYAKNKESVHKRNAEWRKRAKKRGWKARGQIHYRAIAINLLMERDNGVCGICGKSVSFTDASIDHIVPWYITKDNHPSNLQLAHLTCNMRRPRK